MTDEPPTETSLARTVPAFSLVRGGPMYRLARSLRLIDDSGRNGRLAALLVAVTWLPLIVLPSIIHGYSGTWPSVVSDIGVHVRLLVGIPLMLLAERSMHLRTERCIDRLAEGKWADDDEAVARIVTAGARRRDALVPEVITLGLAFAGSHLVVWGVLEPYGIRRGPQLSAWSDAALWYALISLPIYQFLVYRWLWRWGIWVWMLRKLSQLRLRPIATHPDCQGGLSFLTEPSVALAWVILATAAVQAGVWANQVVYDGAALRSFRNELAVLVVLAILLAFGPLFMFTPTMWRTRFLAIRQYQELATAHSRWFHARWIERRDLEDLFGNGDISAQCDLASVYAEMTRMRLIPIGPRELVIMVGAVILPMIPLIMIKISFLDLVMKLGGVVLGGLPH
jgi:hypothetical protein